MKSALDTLIEELEAGAWEHNEPCPPKAQASNRVATAVECGSPQCAGCYEVELGVRVHPPKGGASYRKWLERWQPKGKLQ
jgi:hypothetical protein